MGAATREIVKFDPRVMRGEERYGRKESNFQVLCWVRFGDKRERKQTTTTELFIRHAGLVSFGFGLQLCLSIMTFAFFFLSLSL